MEELTLTTPALLFSAVSLILLAYTNRFLSYAQLVRTLKEQHLQHPSKVTRAQIDNLRAACTSRVRCRSWASRACSCAW